MSVADDSATMVRVGGDIFYTGQSIGQGINMAADACNWIIGDEEDDEDAEPPVDEEVFTQTQGLLRRGASRSRSSSAEERNAFASRSIREQPSGSSDSIRSLRRGASRSRSVSPFKKNPKK